MARTAETVVLRGDGMEHDRSTPVAERSYNFAPVSGARR
jgi:hypothetical protein